MVKRTGKRVLSILCTAALLFGGGGLAVQSEAAGDTRSTALKQAQNINDNTTAMKKDEYAFDHAYVKPGDTLKVLHDGKPVTDKVSWTVQKVASGSENNVVDYKVVDKLSQPELAITNDYLECMIYGETDNTKLTIYCSRTPVMYINSETAYYDVKKEYTNESTTSINLVGNDTYSDESLWYSGTGQVKLRGNSTAYRPKLPFKLKLSTKADLLGLGTQKDAAGKMTSYPNKHWVLLANDIDHSLLRNKLLYDFSGDIGTEVYFDSTNVTLIYNGQYEGVYQLCEHRRVDPGRIDITNWTGIGEDAANAIGIAVAAENGWDKTKQKKFTKELEAVFASDYSWIDQKKITYTGTMLPAQTNKTFTLSDYGITLPKTNGGFLAEMDFYSIEPGTPWSKDTLAGLMTNYWQPLYFSAPEPGEDAGTDAEKRAIADSFKQTSLYKYANKYTQTFEYALHSDDFYFRNNDKKYTTQNVGTWGEWSDASYSRASYTDTENEGKHYSELFDMDSLVNNFLFCEYAMNWDSMKNSFFYYKDVDKLAKFGPQWDFDWCWGNKNMYNIYTNYPTGWQTTIREFTVEQYYQSVQWNRMLIRDPYFLTLAYEKYHSIRPIIENMIKQGGLIDQYKDYLKEAGAANDARWKYTYNGDYYSGSIPDDFENSIKHIKSFLKKRVAWLDNQFNSVPTLIASLGYYGTSRDISISGKAVSNQVELTAETTDTQAAQIAFQINGTTIVKADVKDGIAKISVDKAQLKASGLNVAVANELDKNGNYLYLSSKSKTGNYNVVKSDYITFDLTNPDSFQKEQPDFEDPVFDYTVDSTQEEKFENSVNGTTVGAILSQNAASTTPNYVDGYAGKGVLISGDGSDGIKLNIKPTTKRYVISFWINANASTKYTPMIFMGNYKNGEFCGSDDNAQWISIAAQDWLESLSEGPMVWSRNVPGGAEWNDLVPYTQDTVKLNEWHKIALAADGAKAELYVDGGKIGEGPIADIIDSSTTLFVGVNNWDTPFNGIIDEIKITSYTDTADGDDDTEKASLTLDKASATLYTGKASNKVTVEADVTGASKDVTWSTSNANAATVDNGVIKAVARGTATITATANGIKQTVEVTVKNPTITVKNGRNKVGAALNVTKGKAVKLTVSTTPKKSGVSLAKLSGNDKKVLTASLKNGTLTVKGKKKGTAVLSVKSGKATKKIKVKVK